MAGRRQDLETRIIAKDDASKTFDKVADKAEQLEKPVEIPISADDKASDDIRSLSQRLAGLSDEEKTVVLRAKVDQAERAVQGILKSLSRVDSMSDEEVTVRIEALDNAKADLDRVQDELRQLDGDTATVHVDSTGVDELINKLDSIPGKFSGIGSSASSAFASAGLTGGKLGAAAGVAALAAAALSAADSYADIAIDAKEVSNLTGASVEQASRLNAVWKSTDAEVKDLQDVLLQMDGVLKSQPELAAQVGVKFDENTSAIDRFLVVTDAMKFGLIDATTAGTLLGEEGVRQVNRLNTALGDATTTAEALAGVPAGSVVNDEDVDNAIELRNSLRDINAEIAALAGEIGTRLLPVLTKVDGVIRGVKDAVVEPALRPLTQAIDIWDDWRGSIEASVDPTLADAAAKRELADAAEDAAVKQQELNDRQEDENARRAIAQGRINAYYEVQRDILDAQIGIIQGIVDADQKTQEWTGTIDGIKVSLADAMEPFEDGTAAVDAFKDALDKVGLSKGMDTLDRLGDQKTALKGVYDVIKENEGVIPNLFKTGRESSQDFRDALADLGETYETELLQVLEDSGGKFDEVRDKADRLRMRLAADFAEKLGLDLTVQTDYDAVVAMVDAVIPPDKEIELGIKLAQQDLIKLKADLAIAELSKLLPATALQLQVDMAEGEIGPREAAATAQTILDENGVEIDLGVNSKKANDDLVLFARQERNATVGVVIPEAELAAASASIDAGPGGRGWPAIELPVTVKWFNTQGPGGTSLGAVPVPGIAGLSAGPLAAPTAMAGPSMSPLMLPVAAPRPVQPIVINQTIQAAVIGDPFAIARAMEEGTRRAARLMPRNP